MKRTLAAILLLSSAATAYAQSPSTEELKPGDFVEMK